MKSAGKWILLAAAFSLLGAALGLSALGETGASRFRGSVSSSGGDPANAMVTAERPRPRVVGFGHVDVEGGAVPLSPAATGQVAEAPVEEGEHVRRGQPLLRLKSDAAEGQVKQAQAALAEAKVRLAQAQRAPADHRLRRLQQEQALAAATAAVEGQQRQVKRLEGLSESSSISAESYASAKDQLERLRALQDVERLKLDQLDLDDPQEKIALAQAAMKAATAQLDLAEDQLARHTLKAPSDGLILRLYVASGQALGANATRPAVWFCPDKPHIVRCEIDQEFADRVAAGMTAEMYDDHDGGHRWTGVVTRCSDWIAPRRSLLDEPFQRNDVRTLECIVAIDPGQAPLRIGRRLRVMLSEPASREKGSL